ncbi:HNH endonuclease [Streptomyces lavendofoliae]|uniref:HNH endonuclease n=1 Tax=Streptomyces lavendofoliae TaxID=67314 RepID=UPI001E617B18|nr:HNH endonuclease signature motif containing protein [Streptomyces lavendofoliae]
MDPTDKAVYAALASFIDSTTGRSAPSEAVLGSSDVPDDVPTRKRLAACIGRTMQTVDRSIKRLEAMGAIRVDRRVHPDNPKLPIPSVYELLPYKPQPPLVQKPVIPGPRKRLPISATKRARILDRDGHRCRKCGVAEDLTIDHVLHWSRGGSNADDNLRVLCRSCNSRRHDGDLEGIDS